MAVVRRVGVFSLAKVLGALYAAIGLVFGALVSLFAMLGSALGAIADEQGGVAAALGVFFGVGAIILLPIIYGVMGFIGGAVTAFIYNLVAGAVGGIEIELQ